MKVQDLLTDESKWAKRAFARDGRGVAVPASSDEARCWCVVGAITVCYPNTMMQSLVMANVIAVLGHSSIGDWNDDPDTTFEDVLRVVKKAEV